MPKVIDQGTYSNPVLPEGQGVLRISANQTFKRVYMLGEDIPQYIVLEQGANLDIVILILEQISKDIQIQVHLAGPMSRVSIQGLYMMAQEQKCKISVLMHHRAPDCQSFQNFKGLVSGTSHFTFSGKIIVAPCGNRTEAYQENHNISLSPTAKVDTIPQLEIYVDDVKCSHGATIGKLDANEQFYMLSRGIPEMEAKKLQIISFLSPITAKLEKLQMSEYKDVVIKNIDDFLQQC